MGSRDEKDKTKVRKEKLAGYFYNLSQLIFTGTGVGGVLLQFCKESLELKIM